jgi:pyruvate ferredoxin oxidoreductase delta subunit
MLNPLNIIGIMINLKGWRDVEHGAIIGKAGNSGDKNVGYKTGAWRVKRPILDKEKCTNCMICWAYCPDTCIVINKEKTEMLGMDIDFCKGCGLCAATCPVKCIEMKDEKEFSAKNDNHTSVLYKSKNEYNKENLRWNE